MATPSNNKKPATTTSSKDSGTNVKPDKGGDKSAATSTATSTSTGGDAPKGDAKPSGKSRNRIERVRYLSSDPRGKGGDGKPNFHFRVRTDVIALYGVPMDPWGNVMYLQPKQNAGNSEEARAAKAKAKEAEEAALAKEREYVATLDEAGKAKYLADKKAKREAERASKREAKDAKKAEQRAALKAQVEKEFEAGLPLAVRQALATSRGQTPPTE